MELMCPPPVDVPGKCQDERFWFAPLGCTDWRVRRHDQLSGGNASMNSFGGRSPRDPWASFVL